MLLNSSDRRLRFMEAATGASAVRTLLNMTPLPECVLLDYNLPDMNALEVLAALTGADGLTICPVVVLKGGASREDGKRVLRAGAHDYIGKDWSSPRALNRSVENACERWTMARELRQRGEALRTATDRERFRSLFADSIRDVQDEHELRRVASRLLGVHLGVNRLLFAEVRDDECVVEGSYVSDVQQIDGVYRLADYGPVVQARLLEGESIVVEDMRQDADYSPAVKLAYADLDIVSHMSVPILKGGRLVALVGAHQKTPRIWTSDDALVARDLAARAWLAIVQLRSEAKLLASQVQLSQIVTMMPSFSAVFRGPGHVVEQANQAFHDIVQRGPEILGLTFVDAFPEFADQEFPALLETVYRTGEQFETKGRRALVQRGSDAREEIFVDFAYLPLREADGQTSGIFVHGVDRTAEIRATHALAQRERELQSVTDSTPDGLTRFDREFRVDFVNPAAERMIGRSRAELIGRSYRQLGVAEALCDQWEAAIQHVFDHNITRSLNFSLEIPNLGLRYYASRVVPEFNEDGVISCVLGVTHDITKQKEAQERVRQSEARFELALESTNIMVYTTDNDLRYTWIRNPHPDFDPAQIVGRRDDEIVSPEAAEPLIRLKQDVLDTGVGRRSEFAIDIDGTRVHYDLIVVPLHGADGGIEGVTVAAMDITDRKLAEESLRDADRRKTEFLATLSHELRNPLAPIRTGLELLKLSPRVTTDARVLPMMERQLEHLVRLIDDLMDVSRISSGKVVLRRERVTFQEVAAVAMEASRHGIDVAGHTLTTDWPAAPVWLDADPTRLAQIFSNLLSNSAKYTPAGGGITFSALEAGENIVISVADTGVGIAPEFLGTVFDMFTQIGSTRDRAQGGLGIGLSLVKTLVEMHGGQVEVTSSGIDQGSTFTVTLPLAPASVPDALRSVSPPIDVADAATVSQRILVVDDNVDAAESMMLFLASAGHTVRVAFGGREALEMAWVFRPEVVFLDIGLPDLSGYDVARELLANEATASARLIALTGWGAPADHEKSRVAGFETHLTKPVDMGAVMALLAAHGQSM